MTKEITINNNVVVIEKLPLRKYAELLKALEVLPKYIKDFSGKSGDEILVMLPSIIGNCYPDIVRVLQVATNLTEEQIDQFGLDDLIVVIQAVLEVNNFKSVFENVKKMTARPQETVEVN